MAPFSKPETVLKQAEGLVSVGQTHAALQSLSEMFSSKRFRSTPLASLEPIMLRFMELCVELRKGRAAKEGLMQYKNIAQNTSVGSIEVVVSRFIEMAETKVREAQDKAKGSSSTGVADVDDLEASETPESILLGAVSVDQSQDRTDRALVTPWLKFLWEAYRTSLETLKNNSRLETIYQTTAQGAFRFCLAHSRKVEFRRLCDTLRLHLANVGKYAHQPHSINLGDAETLQHHLDTRFAQLGCSVELELWQEAFRSVEDVHNLLTMANANNKSTTTGAAGAKTGAAGFGGMVKPSMMAGYYDKLAKIFLMSGNALYHAAALGRYYALATSSSTAALTADETRELAGRVLISALAVPSTSSSSATGSGTSSSTTNRLTSLLNLSKPPTRASLLKDALNRDVLRLAPEEVKALYVKLEVEFEPLGLVGGVAPILAVLAGTNETSLNGTATENGAAGETKHLGGAGGSPYKGYLPLLHHALLARLLSHLSQVYDCIKIDYLRELVSPLDGVGLSTPAPHLEAYIMLCARRGQLDVRVDHAQGCIWFLDEPFVGLDSEDDSTPASGSTSTAGLTEEGTDVPSATEGDRIQPSATTLVRTRLSSVAGCLHRALSLIQSPSAASSTQTESEVQAESRFLALITPSSSSKGDSSPLQQYRKSLLLHTSITARRRQLAQELAARAQAQNMTLQAEIARKAAAESARLSLLEASQREARRRQDEVERVRRAEAEKYAKGLVEGGVLGKEVVEKLSSTSGGALDTTTLIAAQVLALEKSKASFSTRLKGISKRIDHLERAYRISELELLKGDWERQSAFDRTEHASRLLQTKEQARKYWEAEREEGKRLGRMYTNVGGGGAGDDTPPSGTKGHWELRRDTLLRRKGEEFALKREKATKRIELEKNKRREEVARRIAQRKADLAAEAAAEARREAEEREAIEREEREEREREEREREEREREEREREEREREETEKKEREEREREERRKEREEERRKATEVAQLQAKREEEALERRRLAKLGGGSGSPAGSVPATPTRASVFGSSGPTRSESPTPASGAAAAGKYRPGALGGTSAWRTKAAAKEGGDVGAPAPSAPSAPSAAVAPAPAAAVGGWRAKEEAKRAAAGVDEPMRRSESSSGSAFGMRRTDSGSGGLRPSVSTSTSGGSSAFSSSLRRTDSGTGGSRPMRTESPIPPKREKEEVKDEDGFTVVAPKAVAAGGGVWKPKRGGAAGSGGR